MATFVMSNDNWMDNSAADQAELTANQLAPTNDLESAMVVTLPADPFTADRRRKERCDRCRSGGSLPATLTC